MKTTRRLLALALVMIMCLGLATVAFAGDITVNKAADGETYTAYKVLDVTLDSANGSYAYQMTKGSAWESVLAGCKINGHQFTLTPSKSNENLLVVTNNFSDADAEDLAAYLAGHIPSGAAGKGVTASKAAGAETATAVFNDMDDGYYLVISSLGTKATLDTTDGTVMEEKNSLPNISKTVDESAMANGVGGKLTYTVTIAAEKGAKNYVVTDTMSKGLTFNNDIAVTLDGAAVAAENYRLTKNEVNETTKETTLELTFEQSFLDTLENNQKIAVTYSATINADAVEVDAVTNKAQLNYGNNSHVDCPSDPSTAVTQITVNKVDGANARLNGAEFDLYDATGTKIDVVSYTPTDAVEGTTYYRPAVTGETGVKITAGVAVIDGLKKASYELEETKAPDGYNMLTARESASTDNANNAAIANVINNKGSELPSTGGIGTTIFYVIGGILVIGAGVLLVVKKRMAHNG